MSVPRDPDTLEYSYVRGLAGSGCELRCIALRQKGRAEREHPGRRMLRRFAPELAYHEANLKLLAEAATFKPNVVWIFKGMEVYPRALRKLRAQGITLVNYNPDHPFMLYSRGTGNRNVSAAIPCYHLHITYSRLIARDLRERYPTIPVSVVPFGHEVSDADFGRIQDEPEVVRACFVGAPDLERRQIVLRFVEAGLPIDVYGLNWDRHLAPSPLLRLNGFVSGDDLLRTLRRYRVQLNVFRPHNVGSHNMRSFEVPAAGGIMLAEDSPEHRDIFEGDRETFYFKTLEEMIARTRAILEMPKAAADAVRAAARKRSVTSGYSYKDRAKAALDAIDQVHRERTR